jgi:hypothetical protein
LPDGLSESGSAGSREAIRRLDEEFIGEVGSAVIFVLDYTQGGKRHRESLAGGLAANGE